MNARDISVIVTTFNESANIERCLDSVRGFGEIVVVDSFSGDDTLARCRGRCTTLYQRRYVSPADQKNWAAARARNDWVLVLDADEWLEPDLRAEIDLLDPASRAGFWIRRRSDFLGRTIRHCGWQRDKVLRLYDRRRGRYPDAWVHEEVVLDGEAGILDARLRHNPYRDVAHHLEKIESYTTSGARQYAERGGRAPALRMVTHPPFRFLRMYVMQGGFLDAYPGLVLCLLGAYGVFLKYAKAWERTRAA
ncbi:MAG TPA: glycosyltransferase family 2 protein [Candidatus Krumholzibacteria bacterium]|nr:glycosyltransferase family 2 protein [Candidatus Krumholzibacteria bacterium]